MKHLIRPLLAILLSFMGSLQAHSQEDLYISTGRFKIKKTIAIDGIYWKGFSTFWESRGDSHFMRYAELAIKEIQDDGSIFFVSHEGKVYAFNTKKTPGINPQNMELNRRNASVPDIINTGDTLYLSEKKLCMLRFDTKIKRAAFAKEREFRFQIQDVTPDTRLKGQLIVLSLNNPLKEPLTNTLDVTDFENNVYSIPVKYDSVKTKLYLTPSPNFVTLAAKPSVSWKSTLEQLTSNPEKSFLWSTSILGFMLLLFSFVGVICLLVLRKGDLKNNESKDTAQTKRIDQMINELNKWIRDFQARIKKLESSDQKREKRLQKFADAEAVIDDYFNRKEKKYLKTKLDDPVTQRIKNEVDLRFKQYLIENGQPSRRPFRRIYDPVKRIPVPGKPHKR